MANPGAEREDLFRRYLTRNLPEEELSVFSDRLLRDPGLSDDLRDFEDEWIDARARGELSAPEAARVDTYLAHTGQQHRLRTARRLASLPQAAAAPRRRPSLYWLAAAAAIVLAVFGWQSSQRAVHRPQTAGTRPAPAPPFAILLTPGTRSAEPRLVTIPPGAARAELQLALDTLLPAGSYYCALQSSTGRNLVSQAVALAANASHISLVLDSAALPPGSYRVLLFPSANSDDLINAYSFAIASGARK